MSENLYAFPWDCGNPNVFQSKGMTLRDWFAGMALASGLINPCDYKDAGEKAYIVADAMLKAREAKP